jgi:hypothetical protein
MGERQRNTDVLNILYRVSNTDRIPRGLHAGLIRSVEQIQRCTAHALPISVQGYYTRLADQRGKLSRVGTKRVKI